MKKVQKTTTKQTTTTKPEVKVAKEITARLMSTRISPKKLGPVLDLIKNKTLQDAKLSLRFDRTKGAAILLKVIQSAEANAVTNNKLAKENLMISRIWVGPGPMYKSGRFAGRGNIHPILKRTSHIYVNLRERVN
jgi:large subunit ribosomal protein L22